MEQSDDGGSRLNHSGLSSEATQNILFAWLFCCIITRGSDMTEDMQPFRLTLVQTTSSNRHEENIALLDEIGAQAVDTNSNFIALPEVFGMMNRDFKTARQLVVLAEQDPVIRACQKLAAQLDLWIHLGSTPVLGQSKFRNHSALIDKGGNIVAQYDKIHLFDIQLQGQKPTGESTRFEPGQALSLVTTPFAPIGLTICYDLRFPHVFRRLAQAGCLVCFVPSAFTVATGRAHWEVLLRARAIENGMWIVAAAQVGRHADGRETWGHSMIVSPWGEVICDLGGERATQRTVEIDPEEAIKARQQIPSLLHDRSFELTRIESGKL